MPAAIQRDPAPITPGTLYPLSLFQRMTGLGAHAMRTARRQGLRVRYLGGRAFVMGDDFISYVEQFGGGADAG